MDEDDFLLDEDDEGYYIPSEETSPGDLEEDDESSGEEEDKSTTLDTSLYGGKLSENELWLITAYSDIQKSKEIEDAVNIVVLANPQHTSPNTVAQIIKDIFHKQGHSRAQNTKYTQGPLRGEDVKGIVDEETDELDTEINNELKEEIRTLVTGFVQYLASRDLSKDSVTSRRRKQRQLPAFIIFMFSSGTYDFILNCPTMPKVYQDQINFALKKIQEEKYKVLEDLIKAYEKAGRKKLAKRVKEMGLSWFYREPAEIRTIAEYRDLGITSEDIDIYREYRPRYTNLTTAITQDIISDYIEVSIDPVKGIFEKLKDKTRSEAINDVKREFKRWTSENKPDSTELTERLIFKNNG